MKQPTTPLPCPICGRKPKAELYELSCNMDANFFSEHKLIVRSDVNLYPVAQWNAYVRRIRNRISKENAK